MKYLHFSEFVSGAFICVLMVASIFAVGCATSTPSDAPVATEPVNQEEPDKVDEADQASSSDETEANEALSAKQSLEYMVPGGWIVFESAQADLNGDGHQDVVALIEHKLAAEAKPPGDHYSSSDRAIMIVTGGPVHPDIAALNYDILRVRGDFGMGSGQVELEASEGQFWIAESGGTTSLQWRYKKTFVYDDERQTWYFVECSKQSNSVGGSAAAADPEIEEYDVFRDFALPNFQPDRYEGECPDPYAGR